MSRKVTYGRRMRCPDVLGAWGPFGYPWLDGDDFPVFVRNYSGQVVTLFGDRGDVRRCRFNLTVPEQGIRGGGVGECRSRMEGSSVRIFNTVRRWSRR
jgi:hypothetical protein